MRLSCAGLWRCIWKQGEPMADLSTRKWCAHWAVARLWPACKRIEGVWSLLRHLAFPELKCGKRAIKSQARKLDMLFSSNPSFIPFGKVKAPFGK
jgi:hypothetical protein